ncbi:MAG: S8 family serine peptidase [Flavobacterium sp.]
MNKKITKALFVAALVFGGSQAVFAQNAEERARIIEATNVEGLREIAQRADREFHEKQERARTVAAQRGWPLEIVKEDGGLSTLVDISDEGKPLYLTTDNAGLATTSRVAALYPSGSLGLSLTGNGMTAGVWDGGYPRSTHVDLSNKYVTIDGSGTAAFHPTHVLGTVIGRGTSTASARGMAYGASGWFADYGNDLSEMSMAVADGLLLSNHSYGFDIDNVSTWMLGAYISLAAEVDNITFNAPYYQPCFSAGNDNNGNYDRLTDRSLSKNGIAVAATNQVSNYIGPGSVTLASFSSWGPADDKRIKPDIATKGVNVLSCSNTTNTATAQSSGTSMSCPGVTGALVLLQQHHKNLNGGAFMRSSTLRGLVAHTADEAGLFDGPDAKFGWGLLNATRAAQTISKRGTPQGVMDELTLYPGQTITRTFTASGTETLIATLAWTDPPGPQRNSEAFPSVKALVNDLDITITKGSETTYPWKLTETDGDPAVRGVNDVDNIEKVEVKNPTGNYVVTISHKGTTLSNPSGVASQAYSLIVTGISGEVLGNDIAEEKLFSIWPNPANDMVNITLSDAVAANASVVLYDVQGRYVQSSKLISQETTIDISGLASGVYFANITNGNAKSMKKVIID